MRTGIQERMVQGLMLGCVLLAVVIASTLTGLVGAGRAEKLLERYRVQAEQDPGAALPALAVLALDVETGGRADRRLLAGIYTLKARLLGDEDRDRAVTLAGKALALDALAPGLRSMVLDWAREALARGEIGIARELAAGVVDAHPADAEGRLILAQLSTSGGDHGAAVSHLADVRSLVAGRALRLTTAQEHRFDALWHDSHLALLKDDAGLAEAGVQRVIDGLFTPGAGDRFLNQLADWAFSGGHTAVVEAARGVGDSDHLRWLHGELLARQGRYPEADVILSGLDGSAAPPEILAGEILYRDVLAWEIAAGADTMGVFRVAVGDRVLALPSFPLYYRGMVLLPVSLVWPHLPGAVARADSGAFELSVDGTRVAALGPDAVILGVGPVHLPVRIVDGVLFAPLIWLAREAGYGVSWHPEHNLIRFWGDAPRLAVEDLVAEARARGVWPRERGVAKLTFDDGPFPDWTIPILDILDDKGVLATFFVLGKQVAEFPHILARTHEQGHAIGNHGYSHHRSIYSSGDALVTDLRRGEDEIHRVTGLRPAFIRVPYGSHPHLTPDLRRRLAEEGLVYHDWNIDTLDSRSDNVPPSVIIDNVRAGLWRQRMVILMHDGQEGRRHTVRALPEVINILRSRGYRFDVITPETVPVQFW